jgi:cytoskeleton protein RodZ
MNTIIPDPSDVINDGDGVTNNNYDSKEKIGSILKAARELRNESIKHASHILRIRQIYLEALEKSQFEKLPGSVYIVGFIRSYADYLGLNAEKIVQDYKSEQSLTSYNSKLDFPSGVKERSIPSSAIIMIGLLLSVIGYGSWHFMASRNITSTKEVMDVPKNLAPLAITKPTEKEFPNKEKISSLKMIVSPKIQPKREVAVNSEKPEEKTGVIVVMDTNVKSKNPDPDITAKPKIPKLNKELSAKPEPVIDIEQTIMPETTTLAKPVLVIKSTPKPFIQSKLNKQVSSRITLRAINDSYIQVRDNKANKLLITRLLKQGETYQVPNRSGLSLITGNAGAINILVDGKLVPSIGSIGTVRRNVVLEVQLLIAGSAVAN